MKNRKSIKQLAQEYGPFALGTYLAIFALVFGGFVLAISSGFEVESAAGSAGLLGAAWLATKLTQPLRIAATLVITPFAAAGLRRLGRVKSKGGP